MSSPAPGSFPSSQVYSKRGYLSHLQLLKQLHILELLPRPEEIVEESLVEAKPDGGLVDVLEEWKILQRAVRFQIS